MAKYYLTDGSKMDKKTIDRKITKAKKEYRQERYLEGLSFCEHCGLSKSEAYDISHVISVNDCQREQKTELSWLSSNLELLCRSCHLKHENKSKIT
tara:strand:- start:40 stop:327 length:288 start_codon:yes stop_codon:yes gene_type:complete